MEPKNFRCRRDHLLNVYSSILTICFGLIALVMLSGSINEMTSLELALCGLYLGSCLLYGINFIYAHIVVEQDKIVEKSLFRSRHIMFKEIVFFSVMGIEFSEFGSVEKIDHSKAGKTFWHGKKSIYIADHPDWKWHFFFQRERAMKMSYRKDLYKKLIQRIETFHSLEDLKRS